MAMALAARFIPLSIKTSSIPTRSALEYGTRVQFRRGSARGFSANLRVDQNCRIRVFSGGWPSCEGKSLAGASTWQSRTGRPSFSAQRSTCSRQSAMATFARLLQQINGAESALGPGGRVEQYQIELTLLKARIVRQLLPATGVDRQAGQLANRREVVRLHKLHGLQLRIELTILATDRQVALGKIQIDDFTGSSSGRAQTYATGVGEQVKHRLTGAVRFDPAAGVAQVKKQQRVLPSMAAT